MPTATAQALGKVQQFRSIGKVIDRFARANSAVTLGNAETGQTWTVETGLAAVYGISEEQVYAVSGGNANSGFVVNSLVSTNILVECRVLVSADYTAGLIFRSDGAHTNGDKFIARLTATGQDSAQLIFARMVNGTTTTLATVDFLHAGENDFVKLGVTLIGSNIRIWVNDILLHERTDTTHETNTRHGFFISTTGIKALDTFEVRDLGGMPTCQALANILNRTERTCQARASIENTVTRTVEAKASITPQQLAKCDVRAYILNRVEIVEFHEFTDEEPTLSYYEGGGFANTTREQETGDVFIWEFATQFSSATFGTVKARCSIKNRVTRTVTAKAFITDRIRFQCTARAKIKPRFTKTCRARAKIRGRTVKTVQGRANIRNRVTRTCTARARIRRIQFECQARARITRSETVTCQARASITPQTLQKVQAMASIRQSVDRTCQARARIRPFTDATARARIRQITTATLEVSYNVKGILDQRLAVNFNITGGTRQFQFCTARARIRKAVETRLSVTYDISYNMPTGCVQRPTERVYTRSTRTCLARARIVT